MSYRKILVDNSTCYRRFHLTYDDEAQAMEKVEVQCLHCGQVIFTRNDHPPVKLARDENLIKTTTLSPYRVSACEFQDSFSPPPQPKT